MMKFRLLEEICLFKPAKTPNYLVINESYFCYVFCLLDLDDHLKPCGSQEFRCSEGKCIPKFFLCDKHNDCDGGEDEHGCPGNFIRT